MAVDRELYRALSGSFPTGVTVVTTIDAAGAPKGLTSQSYIGLSTEPPLMLISVDKNARTLPALQHTRAFCINFLKTGAEDLASRFASKAEEKFAGLSWRPSNVAAGAPMLVEHSVAVAECQVTEIIEAGDHWLFIGRVAGGIVCGGTPLMYYKRTYAAWPEEQPAPAM